MFRIVNYARSSSRLFEQERHFRLSAIEAAAKSLGLRSPAEQFAFRLVPQADAAQTLHQPLVDTGAKL
jgi:hypothetical protein